MWAQKGIFLLGWTGENQLGCSWTPTSIVEIALPPTELPVWGPHSTAPHSGELPVVLLRLQAAMPGSCLTESALWYQVCSQLGDSPCSQPCQTHKGILAMVSAALCYSASTGGILSSKGKI